MLVALLVSLLAGLATSIGGALALHRRVLERPVLAAGLAFAAGAMLFVSFIEILPLGAESLSTNLEPRIANLVLYGVFFAGILLVALIDRLLPSSLNPSKIEGKEEDLPRGTKASNKRLLRSGLLVAVVLALHNFPEGMGVFFAASQDLSIGIPIAIAIALHNIPEGIAIAAPVYAATRSRSKAFWWATISGLTEPLGALAGMALIAWAIPEALFGAVFGLVAGMMVFIAIDELLPAAKRYQTKSHQVVYGLLAGMAVVAMSLVLMS